MTRTQYQTFSTSSKNYLTKEERSQFVLSKELKEITIGLLLGDLNIRKLTSNSLLRFGQGIVHIDYIQHLYELFCNYCRTEPKTFDLAPDKRTGKIYSSVRFNTISLPVFTVLYELFYVNGKKFVPANIAELLTPIGLAY